jgi:hypothetical protein
MKKLLVWGLATSALISCAPAGPVELSPSAQAELAEELEGRVAGEPVSCVDQREIRSNRSIGSGVILFEGDSDILWVNRPQGGCPLQFGRTLVTRSTTMRLCEGEIASVMEPVSGANYGACVLGEFTPYREVD